MSRLSKFRSLRTSFLVLFRLIGCASQLQLKSSESKTEVLRGSICESKDYVDNPDYKQRSEKEYINKLKNGEQVYLQTEVRTCEDVFEEGVGVECAIHKTVKLIWEKDQKPIDSYTFLDSGCDKPNSPSLNVEP